MAKAKKIKKKSIKKAAPKRRRKRKVYAKKAKTSLGRARALGSGGGIN